MGMAFMVDKSNVSDSCREIIYLINSKIQNFEKEIKEKDEKIKELEKSLYISTAGKTAAENMVTQIKEAANEEIKKAYKNGYDAALFNANSAGGTTISQEQSRTLTLTN